MERAPGTLRVQRGGTGYVWVWKSQNRTQTVHGPHEYANPKDAKNAGLKFAKRSKRL